MENVRKTLKKYYFREIVVYFLVYTMFFSPAVALASSTPAPGTLPSVVHTVPYGGVGSFDYDLLTPRLDIQNVAHGTVINWDHFDTGAGATTQFHQVNNSAAVLNRVVGDTGATGIFGTLLANGTVFIVNTRGIVFGPAAYIQARNLVASGIDLRDIDFRNADGQFQFETFPVSIENPYSDLIGDVELRGPSIGPSSINAERIALIGQNVINKGTIISTGLNNSVVMAAGERVLLGQSGSDVFVQVEMTTPPADHVVDNGGTLGTGLGTVSAPGGKVILAAGDIFSTAISGIESLRAEAHRDITLNGAITADGDITLVADADISGGVDGGDVDAQALTAGGTIEISASDTTINLHDDVTADVDILLNNDTVADAGITLDAGQDVVLAADKTLTGNGTLTVQADDDILLGAGSNPGDVTVAGDLTLDAGHSIEVADGGSITAGDDVFILGLLKALGDLTIEATGGGIEATDVFMTVDGSLLSLTQYDSLDMEYAFDDVINSDDTDLFAKSTGGSVTSAKADTWATIEAWAQTFINLDDSDAGGDITTKALTTTDGDILITSDLGKVYVDGPISAGLGVPGNEIGDVKITANEGPDGLDDAIFLRFDGIEEPADRAVRADRDILLNSHTLAADDVLVDAGRDVKVGYDAAHDDYDPPKRLTGEGGLTVEADRDIILSGAVAASALTSGDLVLRADADTADGGDMIAYSTIDNPGGSIDIYSSDGTTELWDNVTAADDVILHNDTVVKAAGKTLESTGDDVVLAGGKTLDSDYDLTIVADDDIILGITNTATNETTQATGSAGDVTANGGDLILNAGDDIYAHGSLTSSGGSDVDITAVHNLRLYGPVTAEDNIYITAVSGDGFGTLVANASLTANTGEIDILTDWYIQLWGPVYAYTNLTLNADDISTLWNDGYIYADKTITADTGNIVGTADDKITLMDVATAGGNITLDADSDDKEKTYTPINDDLFVHGLVAGGYIDLSAGDSTIYIYESADGTATVDVDAGGDIILHNDTEAAAGVVLDAGDDVVLAAGKTLDGDGALTVQATDDIMFGITDVANHDTITITPASGSPGDVSADGKLIVNAGDSVYAFGTLTTTSGGDIEVYSSDDTTFLYGDKIEADGSILLDNTTEAYGDIIASENVTMNGTVELKGTGADQHQEITATTGKLYANQWVDKTSIGNLEMFGGFNGPFGSGDYSVKTKAVTVDDETTDGQLSITGNAFVRLNGNIYSRGSMFLASNSDGDLSGGTRGGYLSHDLGTIQSLHGDVDLTAKNDEIQLYGDNDLITGNYVTADRDILLRDDTYFKGDRKLYAGDDVVLESGKFLRYYGAFPGALTVEAGEDIMFGVNIATHEADSPPAGSSTDPSGDVTVKGDLILTAGDDIWARGKLETLEGSVGNITATAVDDIHLYNTTISADADGTLTLTADFDEDYDGDLIVDGALYGNMDLSGYDVTVDGIVDSEGTLDVHADEDIRLKSNVHSDGVMTMDAGSDIDLNEDSGNTSSDSTITLTAGDDVTIGRLLGDEGNVTANGSMNITAGGDSDDDVKVFGKLTTTNGGNIDVQAGDDVTILGTWSDDISPVYESVEADGTLTLTADTSGSGDDGGNLRVAGSVQGNMYLAGTNVTVGGDVTSFGTLNVVADRNIRLKENVSSEDAMTMNAGRDIRLNQDGGETVSDSTVTLIAGRDVKVEGNLTTTGDNDVGNTLVEADRNINFGGNVNVDGHLEAYSGLANYSGAGSIEADGDVIADTMLLEAGAGLPDYSDSHVWVDGLLQTTGGDLVVEAHHDISLGGNVDSAGNLTLNADRHGDYGYPDPHVYGGDVVVEGTVVAVSNIDMYGNNITLWDDVEAGGNIILTADTSSDFADPLPEGDVVALGDLTSTGGSIEIYSDDDTTYLGGDTTAAVDVLLNNNTRFIGYGDQRVTAQTGMITANGWLDKRPFSICFYGPTDGSLYLHAEGDISLANYVTAADDCLSGGGVSIISNNGRIFTPGYGDRLNVDITGRSDHYADVGVDLPFGGEDSGKAAIIIMSGEDLQLGPDGELSAYGKYYDDVDDRVGVGFLAAPATIGDVPRDEGALFDAAIYVASKGDVDVSSPVSILSLPEGDLINGRPECVPKGAMIVDARDTVTFDAALGGQFLASLAAGDVGDRLEVCSRITEWLFQAVDAARLPFAATASAMSTLWYGNPDSYILRGAGLDNPAITDGRAWVLENPAPSAPLYREAGEPAEGQEFAEGGCPALMEWLAAELGIEEEIQVYVANTFAYSTDIQPCEICARLRDAATILEDPEGAGVAALAQVVNEFVAPDVPPSTEQMTLIAAAFAEHVGDGTYYAAAGQWIDAVAAYVGILNAEMGYSVDDSAAFAGKYVAPVTETGNASLITYVEARLAALGG